MKEYKVLRAKTEVEIWGDRNRWSLAHHAGFPEEPTRITVQLEIQGSEKHGYNLVQQPEGFFAADTWSPTIEDALADAEELYGVRAEDWNEHTEGGP